MTITLPHWLAIAAWYVELVCVLCTLIATIAGWTSNGKRPGFGWSLWSWVVIASTVCVLIIARYAL